MKTYQLDECLNSKRLEASCNAQGKCIAHRFPKRFKGRSIKDPQILDHFFAQGKAIVTNDEEMLSDHVHDIPERHPGLLIIAFSPGCHDELSDDASAKILSTFKKRFPNWPLVPCENSVMVITEKSVEVFHKDLAELKRDLYLEYSSGTSGLEVVLNKNHSRKKRR